MSLRVFECYQCLLALDPDEWPGEWESLLNGFPLLMSNRKKCETVAALFTQGSGISHKPGAWTQGSGVRFSVFAGMTFNLRTRRFSGEN